ncbi:Spy/CpxP family protein refolding chaperone [Paraferrimonas haliotis]|uniref:Periplasmic heavy metal sensor n=1 Tax=Paraferrimonas haliotis TaxID=2013866 RepID=A0AA37TSK2_9GAMM|nr:Spy/CpxP family protein refolding chaperone [Paraferrimonas haliotis]GLS82105.1 hypothetical protein GCM10007894_00820 [Paraferrimonas haliotis]
MVTHYGDYDNGYFTRVGHGFTKFYAGIPLLYVAKVTMKTLLGCYPLIEVIMKKVNQLVSAIALSTSLLLVPITHAQTEQANAQVSMDRKGGHSMHGMKRMLRGLGLSESQKQEISAISERYKEQLKADRQASPENSHEQMLQFISADSFDEQAVRDVIRGNQAKRIDTMVQLVAMQHDIYQVLTPEQQQKYQENLSKAKKRGHKRR